jgi:hypothetical protein
MFERPLRLRLSEKDSRRVLFTVRAPSSTDTQDLSDSEAILLEWEDSRGDAQEPLHLSSTTVGADWADGAVVVDFTGDDLTAEIGAKRFALTVVTQSHTRTVQTGVVEVSDRAADTKVVG